MILDTTVVYLKNSLRNKWEKKGKHIQTNMQELDRVTIKTTGAAQTPFTTEDGY